MYKIYLITNLVYGKQYVGQTKCSLQKRWKAHVSNTGKYSRSGRKSYLTRAVHKHGRQNFAIRVLEKLDSKEMANIFETYYILKLRTFKDTGGYNLTFGGEGTLGRKLSPESIENIKSKQKGKFVSEETRQKQSLAKKGKKPPNFGKSTSTLTKSKQRAAALKRGMSEEQKDVLRQARHSYWAAVHAQ